MLSELMIEKYRGQTQAEEWYVFERGMTDDEIKAMWAAGGEASNRGTEAHLQMQYLAEGYPHRADDPEVAVGKRFFADIPDEWEVYRTEWEILADEEDLAGSIDLLIRNKTTGAVRIYDYKRAAKLPDKMHGYRKQKPPRQHLDDCDGAKYATQLSVYQYMLVKYYGLVIEDRVLMSIHPERPFLTSVPYLQDEVEHYMAERRRTSWRARKQPRRFAARCWAWPSSTPSSSRAATWSTASRRSRWASASSRSRRRAPRGSSTPRARAFRAREPRARRPRQALVPWKRLMPKQGIRPTF